MQPSQQKRPPAKAPESPASSIPSAYRIEAARLDALRVAAWTPAAHALTPIAGIPARPLTLGALIDLLATRNILVDPEHADPSLFEGDLVAYIWRHSPHYRARPTLRSRWHRRRLIRRLARVKSLNGLALACARHFRDGNELSVIPEPKPTSGPTPPRELKPLPLHSITYILDELLTNYQLDLPAARKLPMSQVNQLLTAIAYRRARTGEGPPLQHTEPPSLRKAAAADLANLNHNN